MFRPFSALTAVSLATALTIGVGWACSPNWTETIEVDAIDPDQAQSLSAVKRVGGEAFASEDDGCGDCGDTSAATFNVVAAIETNATGIEFDFPDGKPDGVGFEASEWRGAVPNVYETSARPGVGFFVRMPWAHAGPVQVRVRFVDQLGAAGAWSDPIVVRQKDVSCSGGLGWPLVLLALAWRPLTRRRRPAA